MTAATAAGFAASLRREAQHLMHRPWDLALISAVPLLLGALVWWVFSAGLPTGLHIGVLDQDHSAMSRQLTRMLQATPGLQIAERPADEGQARAALRSGALHAVVLIPRGLQHDIKQGRSADVVLLHNAQRGLHSGLIQRDVQTVVATVSAGIELRARQRRGEPAPLAAAHFEPVRTGLLSLFNTAGDYERFLTLALIPALLHILAMAAGAWAVGNELRQRSLGLWLGAAPARRAALAALLGKLALPWLSLTLVGTTLMLWLTAGSGWRAAGSLGWVLLALAVFLGLSLAMGALAAALSRSLRTALSATGLLTAPAFAFGGMGFPLQAMPPLAHAWALMQPYTHHIRVQTEQLLLGAPLAVSLATPLWMALAAALLLLISALRLRAVAGQPQTWGAR